MASGDVTRIAGNIGALNALNSLTYVNNQLAIHQTRLATGKRLNESADDPAGMNMAITFDIRRNDMKIAISAIGDAKNMLAIAESGLRKISDILVKLKNKVMEAAGSTIGENEREAVAAQMNAYAEEIDQIVESSQWNGNLLIGAGSTSTGSALETKNFFVGTDGNGDAVFADFNFSGSGSAGFTAGALGLSGAGSASGAYGGFTSYTYGTSASSSAVGVNSGGFMVSDLTFSGSATDADGVVRAGVGSTTLATIGSAIDRVKAAIVDVGSMSARLTFKEDAMMATYINTESAYNRIMNADMAEEQVNASKYLILQQTATAMLSQANLSPQFILSLFQ
jgi:flagellin